MVTRVQTLEDDQMCLVDTKGREWVANKVRWGGGREWVANKVRWGGGRDRGWWEER